MFSDAYQIKTKYCWASTNESTSGTNVYYKWQMTTDKCQKSNAFKQTFKKSVLNISNDSTIAKSVFNKKHLMPQTIL